MCEDGSNEQLLVLLLTMFVVRMILQMSRLLMNERIGRERDEYIN